MDPLLQSLRTHTHSLKNYLDCWVETNTHTHTHSHSLTSLKESLWEYVFTHGGEGCAKHGDDRSPEGSTPDTNFDITVTWRDQFWLPYRAHWTSLHLWAKERNISASSLQKSVFNALWQCSNGAAEGRVWADCQLAAMCLFASQLLRIISSWLTTVEKLLTGALIWWSIPTQIKWYVLFTLWPCVCSFPLLNHLKMQTLALPTLYQVIWPHACSTSLESDLNWRWGLGLCKILTGSGETLARERASENKQHMLSVRLILFI